MKINSLIVLSAFCIFLISCGKEDKLVNPECKSLVNALIYLKSDSVKIEVNKLTLDLNPNITENDKWGHKENIDLLIERLDTQCQNITASLSCYVCIYTLPPQSEIILSIDSAGIEVKRIIDILTPDNDILKCVGSHNYYRK